MGVEILMKLHPDFPESVIDSIFNNNSVRIMSMHEEDWFGGGMRSIPELEWQYQQIVDPGCEDNEIEPIED
tara:strand:- start:3534 stop:3746 length:213 start_codon:yes stop_codon:yes gene_type:complete